MEGSVVKRSSREAIVAEAIRLFSERGYPSTSMRDIANAVDLLPGSLYVHISGKEQLLGDIVESGIDRFLAACQPPLTSDEPAALRLRAAIHAVMRLVSEDAEHMLVALHQWKYLTGERRDAVVQKRRTFEAIFTTIVDEGMSSGDFGKAINARIAVLSIIGTLNWAAEWFSPEGPESADQVADEIADLVLSGLVHGPA